MNNDNRTEPLKSFFKDPEGNLVVWQRPNLPLAGWALFKILSMVLASGDLKEFFAKLSGAFLFTWAFLEITNGDSYFRKCLGTAVMILAVVNLYIN